MTPPEVTDALHRDIGTLMNPGTEKRQGMRGFDHDYVDIVDYIIRCTHRIWEERGVGLIYTHYLQNAVVHTPSGDTVGREAVVANTIQALATFPDRRIFADDVVWSGNDVEGFYSSHRITSVGHHYGHSSYGPPTGRRLRWRVVADCLVKENRIYEEWLVRDELSIVRQMGLDERAVVARLAALATARGPTPGGEAAIERGNGQRPPEPLPAPTVAGTGANGGFDVEDFVRRAWHDIWDRRLFNRIAECYAPTFTAHSASGRELYGQDEVARFVLDWLAAFPDGRMTIDHFCALPSDGGGSRTATRWTFMGTHEGWGSYGAPTGRRVRVMGMTHQHVRNGRFVEEWTVFDELNLLVQLYTPGGEGERA